MRSAALVVTTGALLLSGCFRPHYINPECSPLGECPDGLVCNAQLICEVDVIGTGSGPGSIADAAGADTPPDAQKCFGTGIVKVCLQMAPMGAFMTTGTTTINTDTSAMCTPLAAGGDGSDYCVIAATTIAINNDWAASGKRPLVFLATQAITTTGQIDVSSHRATNADVVGAGADPSACDPGIKPAPGGGGGAGGTFTGSGGSGGVGQGAGGTGTGGVSGTTVKTVTSLRGGCPGQDGDGGLPGAAGHGGGAVFFIAGTSITIGGTINAGGEGGGGGGGNVSGGGGAGSGGMIGFDAPMITANASLFANGGSGGEGSREGMTLVSPGSRGEDSTGIAAAKGGNGTAFGGNGGDGSTGDAAGSGIAGSSGTTGNNNAAGAGGGGGGGAGIIKAAATVTFNKDISPAATP